MPLLYEQPCELPSTSQQVFRIKGLKYIPFWERRLSNCVGEKWHSNYFFERIECETNECHGLLVSVTVFWWVSWSFGECHGLLVSVTLFCFLLVSRSMTVALFLWWFKSLREKWVSNSLNCSLWNTWKVVFVVADLVKDTGCYW